MNTLSPSTQATSAAPRSTACIACQKQKVRCLLEDSTPPCQRCQRRGVPCTFRKYTFRDDKGNLGPALVNDIQMIYQALNELRLRESKPLLPPLQSSAPEAPEPATQNPTSLGHTNDAQTVLTEDEPIPSTVTDDITRTPINSLYQITRLKSLKAHPIANTAEGPRSLRPLDNDIVSQGLLEPAEAETLVQAYLSRSDHYLYGIASKYRDLDGIRRASRLLLTAICAVSALQNASASNQYRICHAELRKLISEFIFTPTVELEDLRGLCIASFWLSDVSWTVSGLAIRRALEVELESSFQIVLAAGPPHTEASLAAIDQDELGRAAERMRLWYLLYICDQHLSILYARTPIIQNQESIYNYDSYLSVMTESSCDQRIRSQVALLRILSSASDLFKIGGTEKIPPIFKLQVDNFNAQIDSWAATWLSSYAHHPVVGNYPAKAVSLHYHFAKLLVCSHVFRGLGHDATVDPMPVQFQDTAYMAVKCAEAIIDLTMRDSDLAAAFIGLPHYFHSMIAYACAFMIKTVTVYRKHVDVDAKRTQDMIGKVIDLCRTSDSGEYHVVHWIGKGLQTLMSNCLGAPAFNDLTDPRPATSDGTAFASPAASGYPGPVGDPNLTRDPNLIWNAARQATSSHPVGSFSNQWDRETRFNSLENANADISYADGNFATSPFPLIGPQAQIELYGLGLGLLQ